MQLARVQSRAVSDDLERSLPSVPRTPIPVVLEPDRRSAAVLQSPSEAYRQMPEFDQAIEATPLPSPFALSDAPSSHVALSATESDGSVHSIAAEPARPMLASHPASMSADFPDAPAIPGRIGEAPQSDSAATALGFHERRARQYLARQRAQSVHYPSIAKLKMPQRAKYVAAVLPGLSSEQIALETELLARTVASAQPHLRRELYPSLCKHIAFADREAGGKAFAAARSAAHAFPGDTRSGALLMLLRAVHLDLPQAAWDTAAGDIAMVHPEERAAYLARLRQTQPLQKPAATGFPANTARLEALEALLSDDIRRLLPSMRG